ncbi:MAG: phage integrase SAM-like domain-containing protein [Dysgonomonas sp.]
MATLKFLLRKSRRGNPYAGKICARIIHARKVQVFTLAVGLFPNEWDEQRQKIIPDEKDSLRYRYLAKAAEILKDYREQFDEVIERLEKQGRYNISDIVIGYQSRRGLSGLHGFTVFLSRALERSGQGRTAKAYFTASRALISFNKGIDIPLRHINACMIKEFETYLKERGKAMNTISYYMRMLRVIYRKAVRERLIETKRENPFEGVFTGFQQTRKRALDIEQLRKLNNLDFSELLERGTSIVDVATITSSSDKGRLDEGLYNCWRYFFFCFHARGMSYVDMAYLRKENIRHGVISYYRKKTGQKIEITITPTLKRIIDSFSEEVRYSAYLFPVIRDTNKSPRVQYESGLNIQNKRLKRLAKMAKIDLEWGLTTHVSRHSWATIGKIQNLPLSVISEGLGHSSEKMTYTYLASFDRSTLDKASEMIDLALISPLSTAKPLHNSI